MIASRFLEGRRGRIFAVMHRPATGSGRGVLVVPPFAEEMNKSRPMIRDVARELLKHGVATVVPDLFGTGDSEGEFCDADWQVWKADLQTAAVWARREGWPISALLCVRLGCALGAAAARDSLPGIECTVFWQAVTSGPSFLAQFLRLRVAASIGDDQRKTVNELREQLSAGQALEVAGYELTPRLAVQLEQVRLADVLGPQLGQLHWMDVVRRSESELSTSAREAISSAKSASVPVTACPVVGEPFWSSTEIVRVPALADRTVRALVSSS
ncbi:MAG: hydrolase 2, exosortase A system-associated [Gammaproteobacteria bacterium]